MIGPVPVPKSVDTAPQRRVDTALRLIAEGAQKASFGTKKTLASALAEEILQKAGVKRGDVVKTGVWSAHPASTVRVGGLLDRNCQTPIKGCYCMDASVLPGEWGLPPMVTIVAMAKRLSKHLTAPIEARATLRTP